MKAWAGRAHLAAAERCCLSPKPPPHRQPLPMPTPPPPSSVSPHCFNCPSLPLFLFLLSFPQIPTSSPHNFPPLLRTGSGLFHCGFSSKLDQIDEGSGHGLQASRFLTLNGGTIAPVVPTSMLALACKSIPQQHSICLLPHIYNLRPLKLTIRRKMDVFWRKRLPDNKGLVSHLRENGTIHTSRVADAMEQIDRGLFVPPGQGDPYMDSPVPIGYNATISAPHMHAACLELLNNHLQPGMRALDIGAGSGYLTAIFALLVGETGRSVGVEHIPELTEKAIENVKKGKAAHLLASGCLSLHTGDGRQGFSDLAPYDAIHVGAAADTIPPALLEQLKPGGRMVIPLGDIFQDLVVIDKDLQGEVKQWDYAEVRYVPLTDRQIQLGKSK